MHTTSNIKNRWTTTVGRYRLGCVNSWCYKYNHLARVTCPCCIEWQYTAATRGRYFIFNMTQKLMHAFWVGGDAVKTKTLCQWAYVDRFNVDTWRHIAAAVSADSSHAGHTRVGMWVIIGLLSFLVVEKIFPDGNDDDDDADDDATDEHAPQYTKVSLWYDLHVHRMNTFCFIVFQAFNSFCCFFQHQ